MNTSFTEDIKVKFVLETIIKGYKPGKVIVFGSYANGKSNFDSDLDLLIIKNTNASFFERCREVRRLFKSQPLPLDLLIYTSEEFETYKSVSNHIINIALKSGVTVYEA